MTKRILIIQENGRHARNRQFRECFALQRAFSHLGVLADVWGLGHDNFSQPFESILSQYDAILSLENYDSGWHPDLSIINVPKAFWCIDAHMGIDRYLDFVRCHRFDVVFNSTEHFVDRFTGLAGKSLWLPNAYDSFLIDKMFNVSKTVLLGFCGNVANRREWIEYLKRRWNLHHDEMVIGPDMVRAINSYRIHWNLNVSIDINYRTFETLGCGTFLLTNYTPGIEKLFTPGVHLVTYQNRDDLDQKLSFYLAHPEECDSIAQQGYNHVRQHHTYCHRAKQILDVLGLVAANTSRSDRNKIESAQVSVTTGDQPDLLQPAYIDKDMTEFEGKIAVSWPVTASIGSRGGILHDKKIKTEEIINKKYLFVSGATKSGTTLLASCLSLSDKISFLTNEHGKLEEGQWVQDVYEWGNGNQGLTERYHMTEDHPLATEESRIKLFNCWSKYWDLAKSILGEKSPHNIIKTRFLQKLFPSSKFIILVRNGIVQSTGEALQERRSPLVCCQEWVNAYKILEGDLPYLNEYLIVRYEDLTNDTEKTFDKIFKFIGITKIDVKDKYFYVHAFRNGIKRPDYNKIRDMNLPHIKNFIDKFDLKTQMQMMQICEPIMKKFGYSTDLSKYKEYLQTPKHHILYINCGEQDSNEKPLDFGKTKRSAFVTSSAPIQQDKPSQAVAPLEGCHARKKVGQCSPHLATDRKLPHSLPIAIVTETLNCISGGIRCIVEVLNRLTARGYQTACYVTLPDLRCEWLTTHFPVLPASELHRFRGILISPYSPTAELVARSNAVAKFYWVHSYEPKFPEITGRPDSWRVMSENSYRLPELQYFATSSYVKMILELIYRREVLSPLVPGGVDTDLFRPGLKENSPLRVMFLSRGSLFRGTHDIVKALQIVHRQGVDLDVCVMGYAIDMDSLPHRLVPPLPQPEFAKLLGSADIFIHASHFEGLPLPPLEAMAAKCAVIATYIGASDYLLDGYNALVVPPKRPDKIADALLRLVVESDLRTRIAEGGYQTATSGYTWEHTIDRLEEVLAEGLARIGYQSMMTSVKSSLPAPAESPSSAPMEGSPSVASVKMCRLEAGKQQPLVSAIVSTYNSERFIHGCLEDLEAQTIADKLEIIVVNSGSEQNEEAIVKEFQKKYSNIKYIKTEQRETVYAAWNRGIKAASGKYITNANTDDRHRKDAFEVMVNTLEAHPEISLVYADVIITETENEIFEKCTPVGFYRWHDWDRNVFLEKGCFMGPQPMWRRSLHDEYGYFDDSFVTSGDYEFWLRISQTNNFLHIPIFLGLYLNSPNGIENSNRKRQTIENAQILSMYRQSSANNDIIRRFYSDDKTDLIRVHNRKGEELFNAGNIEGAKRIFEQILSRDSTLVEPLNNLGVIAFQQGEIDQALSYLTRALKIDPNYFEAIENLGKCLEAKKDYPSAIKWFRQAQELNPDD
ncbi:MAG: glycosyltransferase [Deltaproteobacteria bacterium]|nr:glycosyltransferase [Deltaproteobacteria bacterium]MBW2018923.1 glycosyltransferase [Deltaproteobacteria bacterium]MBW2073138.1 glycosyltransferase [Deltaproteobacteria bacterium]